MQLQLPVSAMLRIRRTAVLVALLCGAREAQAQFISVSGSPAPMAVTTAVAGAGLQPKVDASTTYTVFACCSGLHKVTAQINAPMPAGVTLQVTLTAPAGGTSLGAVSLDTTPRDAVTNFGSVFTTRGITYQLSATLAAGVVAVQSRTVTLTLTSAP